VITSRAALPVCLRRISYRRERSRPRPAMRVVVAMVVVVTQTVAFR
jgi:hypothetical protein